MTDLITDAMVEAAARAEWTHEWPIRPWEKVPDDLADHYRECSRHALEAVAPLIAAKAWDEGYAMSERELDHAYGGHPISPDGPSDLCHECGTGNPYRADHIERGES